MKNLVIIPAYNEEQALAGTVTSLQCLSDDFEILVVNDGSLDETARIAETMAKTSRLPLHVVHLPVNCGIGVAMQTGYLFAAKRGGYGYAIQFDGDGQHEATAIPALVEECEKRALDLCLGSRFLDRAGGGFQSTFGRRVGIRFFAWLISTLASVRVTDPTSGFRCASQRLWATFAQRYPDDYPEPETLFWCARHRLRIGEIQVQMRQRQGGVSSIRAFRTVYYMLKVSLAIVMDRFRFREEGPQ